MSDLKLEITQVFDAPLDKVWKAWTDIGQAKKWSGPEGMHVPVFEVDPRVGGEYRMVIKPNESGKGALHSSEEVVGGKYLEIEEKRKLVYTWLWEGQDPKTHTTKVTLLFKSVDDNKTELTLIHSGFADENMKQEHGFGWSSTLQKLKKFLAE